MKDACIGLVVVMAGLWASGCTQIVEMEPTSGPPGTPVYLKCSGMFGDPCGRTLKWDGQMLCDSFPGSFVVPAVNQGGKPGKHRVTLVDDLDADEAFLIFPIVRLRHDTVTFRVTEP